MIFRLDNSLLFPDPNFAEPDGLLAIGGDLSVNRLLLAYSIGIFPWYNEGEPIYWYSPHERFVLFPEDLKISTSMRRIIKQEKFNITFNQNFNQVIEICSAIKRKGQNGTWITNKMKTAYINLHKEGHAHSVEVWENDKLVGGLYGVAINKVFCGESMFTLVPNASKLALIQLVKRDVFKMIDCQVHTNHLESLGAKMIPRGEYLSILKS
jgi:leucyl/phenylalanyl-tRNA--protein transferase